MTASFELGGRKVGADAPPFIIAEMSGNHNQSLERALEIVDAAAKTGAHAIKLQTYTADSITLDVRHGDFVIADKAACGRGAIFTSSTRRRVLRMNGTNRSSGAQKSSA